MIKQRTLKAPSDAPLDIRGVGLHTGCQVHMSLHPAPPNTGIVFRRVDLDPPVDIPATVGNVDNTQFCTTLAKDGVSIQTVEHLLSMFAGRGIDNAYVELDSGEVPAADGSAAPFVFMLDCIGIEEQDVPKEFIRIKKTIEVSDGDKRVRLKPYEGFQVNFTIDFDHPVFNNREQSFSIDYGNASFVKEVARARTFGFKSDYEGLRSQGFALGASLNNTIVVGDHDIFNKDGLRLSDEFVRHKVLDVIGDLYLLGRNLIGAFEGYKSGHALNNCLLKALLNDTTAWDVITYEEGDEVPLGIYTFLAG